VKEADDDSAASPAPFPENAAVPVVWALFGIFWGSLVCLYVPLVFSVPYTGPKVNVKKDWERRRKAAGSFADGAKYKLGFKDTKKGAEIAAKAKEIQQEIQAKVEKLIKHMHCNKDQEKPTDDRTEECWPTHETQYNEDLKKHSANPEKSKPTDILRDLQMVTEAKSLLAAHEDLNKAKHAWNTDKNRLTALKAKRADAAEAQAKAKVKENEELRIQLAQLEQRLMLSNASSAAKLPSLS
jgi:hypothetical protein